MPLLIIPIFIVYVLLLSFQMLLMTGTSKTYWEENIIGKRSASWLEDWFLNFWEPKKIGSIIAVTGAMIPPLGFFIPLLLFRKKYWKFRDVALESTQAWKDLDELNKKIHDALDELGNETAARKEALYKSVVITSCPVSVGRQEALSMRNADPKLSKAIEDEFSNKEVQVIEKIDNIIITDQGYHFALFGKDIIEKHKAGKMDFMTRKATV